MQDLLEQSVCDSMYSALNDSTIFRYNAEWKAKRSQVCAVLDRLRHASSWINENQETPRGENAPTGLMTFMMFASLIKDSVENLRHDFGGCGSTLFDRTLPESRQFFGDVCRAKPLCILRAPKECPTDDEFFQYFRALVFAHSGKITKSKRILRDGEVQHCPFIVEHDLMLPEPESDDYVGVKIYSTERDRDGETLRVRFSALKAYLKSRYDSLGRVLEMIQQKIQADRKEWKKVTVDAALPPLEQLKFMRDEFVRRCEDTMVYEVGRLIELLEAPCSLTENQAQVDLFRAEIEKALPQVIDCFTSLDNDRFVSLVDWIDRHDFDPSCKLNYTLRKIFEYLDEDDRRKWATRDIDMIANDFAKKWVRIDQQIMSDAELKMLITIACYNEYESRHQPNAQSPQSATCQHSNEYDILSP